MHYAWKPNRDSGSVRRHRNPDTKRRHGCSELPKLKVHNGRAHWHAFMRTNFAELSLGTFDVSFAPVKRGFEPGDPLTSGAPVLVDADPTEEPFEYPETPEYVWDYLFGLTNGFDMDEYVI